MLIEPLQHKRAPAGPKDTREKIIQAAGFGKKKKAHPVFA